MYLRIPTRIAISVWLIAYYQYHGNQVFQQHLPSFRLVFHYLTHFQNKYSTLICLLIYRTNGPMDRTNDIWYWPILISKYFQWKYKLIVPFTGFLDDIFVVLHNATRNHARHIVLFIHPFPHTEHTYFSSVLEICQRKIGNICTSIDCTNTDYCSPRIFPSAFQLEAILDMRA